MTLTAMEILERCRRAEAEKRRLRERVEMYRDAATHITAGLDASGARGGTGADRVSTLVGDIDEAERRLRAREKEQGCEVACAVRLLDQLPPLECEVLNRFYLRRDTLRHIALSLGYSYGYVRSRKAEGCRLLRAIPEEEVLRALPGWYLEACGQRKSASADAFAGRRWRPPEEKT